MIEAKIAMLYTIGVEHRYDLKDEEFSEKWGRWGVG